MSNNNYLILLVGKSGTGKSTVADVISKKYGLKIINSYTTRPPRYPGEPGHIYITHEDVKKYHNDMCAYTFFNGNHYFATNKQVDESDIYIIDPYGVDEFMERYCGDKKFITVELQASPINRYKRMRKRGDSVTNAIERIAHDKKAFRDFEPMILVNTNKREVNDVADIVYESVRNGTIILDMAETINKDDGNAN